MGLACHRLPAALVTEFRRMAHDATDRWIDGLEQRWEQDPTPDLAGLSEHVLATRSEFLGACMKAAVERLYPAYTHQEWAECPHCQRPLHRKRFDAKRVHTLQGSFTLDRPYFYCRACSYGFHPLDAVLRLASGHNQYDLQKRVATLSTRVPFEEVSLTISELTHLQVGSQFSHTTLNAVGEQATLDRVIPDTEEIARRIAQATLGGQPLPIVVVAADGAHAPTRPQTARNEKRGKRTWQEVKGFRLYLLDPHDRIVHLASWHQIQDVQSIKRALGVVAQRIDPATVRIVLVGDGADWVWNAMVEHFPHARQVLDFYHCFEHLYVVAHAQYGQATLAARQWAETAMVRLGEGELDQLLGQLTRLDPRDATAKEEIRKLVGYLTHHKDRIRYFADLEDGYPIGSGGIESANKYICHTRLKRPGATWVRGMGNAMLRVRCALYNGTFESVFENYVTSRTPNPLESRDK